MGHGNKDYCKDNKICDELIDGNIEYTKRLDFKVIEKERALLLRTGLQKCVRIQIVLVLSFHLKYALRGKVLYLFSIFLNSYTPKSKIYKNAKFLSYYKRYRVLKNSDLPIKSLYNILRKRFKAITTYDFSTSYRKLLLDKPKSKKLSIFDFTFKGDDKTFIKFSNNGTT